MHLNEIKQALKKQLAGQFESVELGPILSILIEHITGWDQMQQVVHKDNSISKEQALAFETAAAGRFTGRWTFDLGMAEKQTVTIGSACPAFDSHRFVFDI